jgi:hypothetical protein
MGPELPDAKPETRNSKPIPISPSTGPRVFRESPQPFFAVLRQANSLRRLQIDDNLDSSAAQPGDQQACDSLTLEYRHGKNIEQAEA